MITHSGLANYLQWAAETYAAEGCGSVVHSSLSFDLTVTSLWVPLVAGRRVRLLEAEGDADELAEQLRQGRGLSLLKLTPAHLEILEQRLGGEDLRGHVGALVIGGEALYGSGLEFWRRQAAGTRLINEYGPTETVVGCSVYDGAQEGGLGPVSIGRPIANLRMHILDERQEPGPGGGGGGGYIGGGGGVRGWGGGGRGSSTGGGGACAGVPGGGGN